MYPHERSLVKEFSDAPFALIGVNSDKDLEKVRQIVKAKDLSWRSFWNGPKGGRGPISAQWNIRGWPTIVLIDHEGIIRYTGHTGNDDLLHQLVNEAKEAKK